VTSRLTPEAMALVGTTETGAFQVSRHDFQRWAEAVGDRNPLYFDVEYARAHGHPDVVMPPLFLSRALGVLRDLGTLRPDGIPWSIDDELGALPPRRMAGGEEWSFARHVYPGEAISWQRQLVDLTEKKGRLGTFVLITWRTTYTTDDGAVVAVNTATLLALDKEER
jgi:acyl dehydratase